MELGVGRNEESSLALEQPARFHRRDEISIQPSQRRSPGRPRDLIRRVCERRAGEVNEGDERVVAQTQVQRRHSVRSDDEDDGGGVAHQVLQQCLVPCERGHH